MQIEYKDLILNEGLEYYFNPFGGLDDEEIFSVIQPKYEIENILSILKSKHPTIIQFLGNKGRGKTTHLKALFQHHNDAEIFYLDRKHIKMDQIQRNVIFIDSVGRISLSKRMKLWSKKSNSYVITTHWNRRLEFWLAGRTCRTYYFKGLCIQDLEKTIRYRIALATNLAPDQIIINSSVSIKLLEKFGDNFRDILNYLYKLFTQYYANIRSYKCTF